MTSDARTTHAIFIERHGPPDVLVQRNVALRNPGPGEVLLRVRAAGVNFADLVMREGLYATVPPRPYVPGFEVSGEVAEVGEGVEGWRVGNRAVAIVRFGGYAAAIVLPAANLFPLSPTLSFAEAAAVPVAYLTAWVCLLESARVRAGETVLIVGAAGGVGSAAVQLAVAHGLRVIGTAGGEHKCRFVEQELGATACFDSRGDWPKAVVALVGERGVDAALDAVGGRTTATCRRLLGPLGRLVFYGLSEAVPGVRRNWLRAARAWLATPIIHPYSLVQPGIGVLGVHLLHLQGKEEMLRAATREIFRGIEDGRWRPILDHTYPLNRDGAVAAHRRLHARANVGKVVLADEAGALPSGGSWRLPDRSRTRS